VTERPICRTGEALAAYDGQVVRLVGAYRKRMTQRKMNDPTLHFFGYVDIELEGGLPGFGDAPVRVQLDAGIRLGAEVARLVDRRVVVTGRLVMEPESDPQVASPRRPPTLVEVGPIERWG